MNHLAMTASSCCRDCPKLLSKLMKDRQTVQKVAESWQTDEEFGRQFLNGPHPVLIKKVSVLPIEFSVEWKEPEDLLDRGLSLKSAIEVIHVQALATGFMLL
jgi:arachidonate 5-lipoxygenase